MSLARAFTTRLSKPDVEISAPMFIGRAMSQRGGRPVNRKMISSPVALVSTTNETLNKAYDIAGATAIPLRGVSAGSISTTASEDESDTSSGSLRSRETVTDASSIEGSSPVTSENHLSCYFKPLVDTHSRSPSVSPTVSARPSMTSPMLPQRQASHSKKAHESLHRKRSIQRAMSPPPSRGGETRSSLDFFSPTLSQFAEASRESPSTNDLQHLDAVAEEHGQVVRRVAADPEILFMESQGLACFSAEDYMSEIQSLVNQTFFPEPAVGRRVTGWI